MKLVQSSKWCNKFVGIKSIDMVSMHVVLLLITKFSYLDYCPLSKSIEVIITNDVGTIDSDDKVCK